MSLENKRKAFTEGPQSIKILIAKFQEQTKSNSVIEFSVWLDNFAELQYKMACEQEALKKQRRDSII